MSLTQTVGLWAALLNNLTSSPGGTTTPNFHFSSVQSLRNHKYYKVGEAQVKQATLAISC